MSLLPGRFYLDDIFNDFEPEKKLMNMNCDIYEKDGIYNIEMDIPGFDKKDVKIEVEDGYLTVSAKKSEKHEDKDKHYIKRERYSGSFKRQFYIGDVNHEDIKSEFKDVTLNITFPEEPKKDNKKLININ